MTKALEAKIKQAFPKAEFAVPLGTKTTFGVGGTASAYLRVQTAAAFAAAVARARAANLPFTVFAGGSNVVFADRPTTPLIVQFLVTRPRLIVRAAERLIVAEAGTSLAALIRAAIRRGWSGLETLSGIPGTVGGAVAGNAGAYGQSIAGALVRVEALVDARARWLSRDECRFAYRDSIFKHQPWLILRAEFAFEPGEARVLTRRAREIIKLREKKYAPGLACPGSFFKNVLASQVSKKVLAKIEPTKIVAGKIPAGYLLESVGAKGLTTKHLAVADFHGNLIINRGGATCREVQAFADDLRRRVHSHFGLTLEEEVRYLT
jgi:UDP-N-acetylmuramate dehydrogenase